MRTCRLTDIINQPLQCFDEFFDRGLMLQMKSGYPYPAFFPYFQTDANMLIAFPWGIQPVINNPTSYLLSACSILKPHFLRIRP